MSNEKDQIGKSLGLEPINVLKDQIVASINDLENDVVGAKHSIKDLIQRGTESLDELLSVAQSSQHPRAYEVAANFIKTLVDANKELAELSFKSKKQETVTDNRQIHNNYTFIGSTTDLLKMMKKAEKDTDDLEDE